MAYEIPYDSNYGEWYGVPQNVTRLSAVLEQATDEDGNGIGRITASWDMPDNGGTFVAQVSTDGENYTIVETNIRQNSVVLTVLPNTDYYLKIVTVLDINQSSGTVSDLLSATDVPTPNAPVVTVTPSGLRIDVGIIPQGYTASISIDDGEDVNYVDTSNLVYMYLCNAGEYDISVAFMDVNGNIGSYSPVVTVTLDNNIYNLKTPLVSAYVVADDGGDYYTDTAGEIILKTNAHTFKKYNSLPAIGGVFHRSLYRTPLLVSTVADAVKIQNDNGSPWSAQGSFVDANGIVWYYCSYDGENDYWDSSYVEQNFPEVNNGTRYEHNDIINVIKKLVEEADPTLFPTETVEENLFYPTNFTLSSGDTISDEILKSLIAYHRPISINGIVYVPSDYTNGTYTYYALKNGTSSAEIGKVQIDSSWVITITTESGGGGGGGSYTAGDGIDITNDVISLDVASANDLGGIKVGSGLSIDTNGVLSAEVFTLKTHSIDASIDSSSPYYVAEANAKLITVNDRNYFKLNDIPAICGYGNVGGYWKPILLSLTADGVKSYGSYSPSDIFTSLGTIHDAVNDVDWHYSVTEAAYPSGNTVSYHLVPLVEGTFNSAQAGAEALLSQANPQFVETLIGEDLFNPTNYTLSNGDTIADTTLKSLIAGYRPIKVNNETYYFIKLDNGTYYYKNSYNIITVDTSWVVTITADSGGGGGGYVLPIASASTLGGIKVGNNLSIDANGVLSAIGGGGGGSSGEVVVLWEDNNGWRSNVNNGVITLNDSYKNYDFIAFNVSIPQESPTSNSPILNNCVVLRKSIEDSTVGKFALAGYGTRSLHFVVVSDTSLRCTVNENDMTAYKIYGIKIGSGGGSGYTSVSLYSDTTATLVSSLTLNDSIFNYDAIIIGYGKKTENPSSNDPNILYEMVDTDIIQNNINVKIVLNGIGQEFCNLLFASNGESATIPYSYNSNTKVYYINGIKFGGGGSSGGLTVKNGNVTFPIQSGDLSQTVTFDSPMQDVNYTVSLTLAGDGGAYWNHLSVGVTQKTVNGFTIIAYSDTAQYANAPRVDWTAIHT